MVEGQDFLQVALVFGVIGLIGLLLRWAFSRRPGAPQWPANRADPAKPTERRRRSKPAATSGTPPTSTPASTPQPDVGPAGIETPGTSPAAMASRPTPTAEATAAREDYGLLTVVADLGSADEVARARARLSSVGIRSTSAAIGDGRHRILVFGGDAMRARRALSGS